MDILLAVDASKFSRKAASWLAGHVSLLHDKPRITVVNVHPPVPYPGAARVVGRKAIEEYYRDEAEGALGPVSRTLRRAGVAHETLRVIGDPAAKIVEIALARKSALIVMGSHGDGALGGLLLGSVVTKVLARCKVPLLVVR